MDQWAALSRGEAGPRTVMLHNIDDSRHISALRVGNSVSTELDWAVQVGDWKMMRGTTYGGSWDSWYGPAGRDRQYNLTAVRTCQATQNYRPITVL